MRRDDEDDIPTAPARPLTATATLVVRVETCLEEIAAARQEIAGLRSFIGCPLAASAAAVANDSANDRSLPPPARLPVVEPRPSLGVQAARHTTQWSRRLMIALGVLSVAGQVVAIWKPHIGGPIVDALKLLASLI